MIFIDSPARAWWTAPKMNSRLASRRRAPSAPGALGGPADNSPKDIDPRTKTRTTSWSEGLGRRRLC